MSEHDEPKTALTPIEALLSWGVGRDTGGVDRLIPAEDLRRALEEARVLLAEGYTTSPAPEATETVEWEYGIKHPQGVRVERNEADARWWFSSVKGNWVGRCVVVRRRAAGPWVPVDRAADEHEEGGQ